MNKNLKYNETVNLSFNSITQTSNEVTLKEEENFLKNMLKISMIKTKILKNHSTTEFLT